MMPVTSNVFRMWRKNIGSPVSRSTPIKRMASAKLSKRGVELPSGGQGQKRNDITSP